MRFPSLNRSCSVILVLIWHPAVNAAANTPAPPPLQETVSKTRIPLSTYARHLLWDFAKSEPKDVETLGENAANWAKSVESPEFDLERSWDAFKKCAGDDPKQITTSQVVKRLTTLYYLARNDRDAILLYLEPDPNNVGQKDLKITLSPNAEVQKATVPYWGDVELKVSVKIVDSEGSRDSSVIWTRFIVDIKDIRCSYHSSRVWFGVFDRDRMAAGANRHIPILVTTPENGGKYDHGGMWDPAPGDKKTFWLTKELSSDGVPKNRWKKP